MASAPARPAPAAGSSAQPAPEKAAAEPRAVSSQQTVTPPTPPQPVTVSIPAGTRLAVRMAERLLQEGVYVIGFSYPVVPKDGARIRIQMSAAFSTEDLDFALTKLEKVGSELGVISKS